ncbi:hypothetical protein NPIL_246361 [Nephila pilipes]|uniref:Uncharacterized protein n=1 Tax=Nephila pilipes TaxID=299642 RepID=A0A8X6U1I9_NEPPI|nr:hypothetical protein NPIL_246361 [Nephila pilipes]
MGFITDETNWCQMTKYSENVQLLRTIVAMPTKSKSFKPVFNKSAYIPEKNISIEESFLLRRGRLGFHQHVPAKLICSRRPLGLTEFSLDY